MDAITRLYRSLAPVVIGYLRSSGSPSPEDLASDVFVAVIDRIDSFSGSPEQFRSWVLTIAHHRRVDELRRQRRRPEDVGLPTEVTEVRTEMGDVESTAMSQLRARGVIDAMSLLTVDQQSVLMLRVLADLPLVDICRITGKPETAVKALLRRAVASLGRNLAAAEVDVT